MKSRDSRPLSVDVLSANAPCRALLCRVVDIDLGAGFGDLTVRCLAHGEGQVELLDMMFAAIDVQILESAIAAVRVAATAVGMHADGDSKACSDQQCRGGNPTGTGHSEKT